MLNNKIYKHFFIELSKHFFIVLFTFAAIVWTVQAVNFLDLIVEDGHAVSLYLNYSLLNIPKIITKFIPLSFLLSLVLVILKFDNENELMILWTSGLNKLNIINFFLKVSIIVTLMQLLLASFVNPNVLNYSRSLIKSSSLDFISSIIKTNEFNDTIEGLTIYVEGKNESGVMKNIFIRDDSNVLSSIENDAESKSLTIYAEKGKIINGSTNSLLLENGVIHTENRSQEIQRVRFKRTELLLKNLKTKSITYPKIQETPTEVLLDCFFKKKSIESQLKCESDKDLIDILSEINRRFGMPLYIPFLTLLCSFLLVSREESKVKGFYKYLYFGLAFIALLSAEILVRYSGKSLPYTLIYYLLPILFIPIVYLELVRRFYYENLRK